MLRVAVPAKYLPERTYVTQMLLGEFLGLAHRVVVEDREDVLLTRDGDDRRCLLFRDGLFATPEDEWLQAPSLPSLPLASWDAAAVVGHGNLQPERLPVLFGEGCAEVSDDRIRIGVDVFGGAFFLLTQYEFFAVDAADEHGRMAVEAATSFRGGFLHRPLVNEYVALLAAVLQRLWPGTTFRRRRYRLSLTHDVDRPRIAWPASVPRLLRATGGDVLKRRDLALAGQRVVARAQARRGVFENDPANTFGFLLDSSEQHGLQSAFYFMAHRERAPLDGDYWIGEPWIRSILRKIHARGHTLGLHASYRSFRNPELVRAEFSTLLSVAREEGVEPERWGGRQHYLRWEPETWRHWEQAGLAYDSTLGFSDQTGFRCGVCYPFPVFDLTARSPLALREHPLIAMDMALPAGATLDRLLDLKDACQRFGGELVLLWHNTELITARQRRLYSEVLAALA